MQKVTTETQIGGTLFVVTAETSPAATETLEKKLERLICQYCSSAKDYKIGNGSGDVSMQ